jgi:hypothetical protein
MRDGHLEDGQRARVRSLGTSKWPLDDYFEGARFSAVRRGGMVVGGREGPGADVDSWTRRTECRRRVLRFVVCRRVWWQRRRVCSHRCARSVQAVVPIIARRAVRFRLERSTVGRRLRGEDEGIRLESLVSGAHDGPQVDDAVIDVAHSEGATGRRGGIGGLDGRARCASCPGAP